MIIYISLLSTLDKKQSAFFGYDISEGWYKVNNDMFGKIYFAEELDPPDVVHEKHSTNTDIVIEEAELYEQYNKINSISDAINFYNKILDYMEA